MNPWRKQAVYPPCFQDRIFEKASGHFPPDCSDTTEFFSARRLRQGGSYWRDPVCNQDLGAPGLSLELQHLIYLVYVGQYGSGLGTCPFHCSFPWGHLGGHNSELGFLSEPASLLGGEIRSDVSSGPSACMRAVASVNSNSATPWTAAHQALLAHEILQARILEWVAIPSSKGSSGPRGQTRVSCSFCLGRQILYY